MAKFLEAGTPLGEGVLLLRKMSGHEELGRLPEFQLEFVSKRGDIRPEEILGKNITWLLHKADDEPRYFNGFVTAFAEAGEGPVAGLDDQLKHGYFYRAHVTPWLWFLTRASNCRIFQNMNVLEIAEKVFEAYPFANLKKIQLRKDYPKREFSVQYRETDFNFVCRLFEQEGLYFTHEYDNARNTLVLMDSRGAHTNLPAVTVPFHDDATEQSDCITHWGVSREIQPGKYSLGDFNFHTPKNLMTGEGLPGEPKNHDLARFELYDFPGEFETPDEGNTYAHMRLEEHHANYERYSGSGTARDVAPGQLLTLQDHARSQYNAQYMVTAVSYTASTGEYASGGSDDDFKCEIAAISSKTSFRPARLTPKPIVQGPQTAIVVGEKGEEIYTDKEGLGRIKVQFHWDRYGKADENSSCWVRVAQPIAGSGWGFFKLPRIGHEVVVEFLEGDPDDPIVTGSVYNDEAKPGYALPTQKTRGGFKSHSTKGGSSSNFNELTFEDKKGEEDIYIHAEKDKTTRAKHDQVKWIGNEDHLIIKKDAFEKREGDHHITLKGDRNEQLEEGSLSFEITKGDLLGKVKNKLAYDVGTEIHLKSGTTIVIESGSKLSLVVGSSHVTLEQAKVTIQGAQVAVKADAMIEIDAAMTKINSGVGAGSKATGSGASPEAPKPPREAGTSKGGEEKPAPAPVPPEKYSPQAKMFDMAAQNGTPFCEICDCPPAPPAPAPAPAPTA
jgi:type VI secretion system secreted protein VgrG